MTLLSLTGARVGGRYEVRRVLGRGPRGTVLLCRDVSNDVLVAVKLPHPQLMASETFRSQFWLELVAAGHLRSTHLLPPVMFGEDLELGTYYVVAPYSAQPDLASVLRVSGSLPERTCVEIGKRVLEALAVAHARDVCHLNLKPSNVLVELANEEAVRVRIGDFGYSHLPDIDGRYGTAEYGAPEQAQAPRLVLEPRSDLYSVGVMLYEMLTSRRPFEASSAADVVRMHCGVAPPPPSGFRPVSVELEAVCLKALSKTPDARYPSARDMFEALEALGELSSPRVRVRERQAPDSLAPISLAAEEAQLTVPKRRAGILLAALVAVTCVGFMAYDPLARFVQRDASVRQTSTHPASAELLRPAFIVPDENTAPDPAPPVEPEALEAPQLVAIAQPSAAGSVSLGAVLPHTEAAEQLRSALDSSAIARCYRDGLSAGVAPKRPFGARLDLETAVDGRVRWSKLRAPRLPLAARQCIERAALVAHVAGVRGENLGASVFVRFDPR